MTKHYGAIVGGLTRKATSSMLLLVAVVVGILLLGKVVPGGFIPEEDKGYVFVSVQLPEGASLQRLDEVSNRWKPSWRTPLACVPPWASPA